MASCHFDWEMPVNLDTAVAAHAEWKLKFRSAISSKTQCRRRDDFQR